MALLNDLLAGTLILKRVGNENHEITGLCIDSRKVENGSLFFARQGVYDDGHAYIEDAVRRGAVAVICEEIPADPNPGVVFIEVENSVRETGTIAAKYYGNPSDEIVLIGVTGTNGKTTVVTLCYELMEKLGYRSGLMSTVVNRVGNEVVPATQTTPDVIEINRILRALADSGCSHAFMEVSSHALDQDRVFGIRFSGAVFTNITHEHLDYHKTFRAYMNAKKKLFDGLDEDAFALINADSKRSDYMVQNTNAEVIRFGLRSMADIKARVIENAITGLHLEIDGREVYCYMKGLYNASNLLAAYGIATRFSDNSDAVLKALSELRGAEGRFEVLQGPSGEVSGIVDYAHTPDAVEKVLESIRGFSGNRKRVITVIGCGGNKDREKRPMMAYAVARKSDIAVFTEDNPRTEDPEEIINEMKEGLKDSSGNTKGDVEHCEIFEIIDRAQAIKVACNLAKPGDIILVAGKGHEKYQDKMGTKVPFDDKKELQSHLP